MVEISGHDRTGDGTVRPTRRSVLAGIGGIGMGTLAGCNGILGGGRVRWELEDTGGLIPTGETLSLIYIPMDGPTSLKIIDPEDGSVRREREVPTRDVFRGDGQRLYGSGDESLVAFEPDGDDDWQTDVARDNWRLEPGEELVVRMTNAGILQAYDPDTGRHRWERSLPVEWQAGRYNYWYSIILDDSGVVVPSISLTDGETTLEAFTLDGGNDWHRTTDAYETRLKSAGSNDDTVVVAFDDYLVGLDRSTGERRWRETLAELPVTLDVVDERAYMILGEELVAYDVASGERLWSTSAYLGGTGGPIWLAADDRGPVVSTEDGGTTAFSAEGDRSWEYADASGGIRLYGDLAITSYNSVTALRRE